MNFHIIFAIVALIGSSLGKTFVDAQAIPDLLQSEGLVEDPEANPGPKMSMNKEEGSIKF